MTQQSLRVVTVDLPTVLIKHIGAVHNHSPLSMMQRKISNIFLGNALKTIAEDKYHQISLQTIMHEVGWDQSSHANEYLKQQLIELSSLKIEWNILGKDKKNGWVACSLLADISLLNGYISYSYPKTLRDLLAAPSLYAKLNLNIQRGFRNKHALILWEFICGDLCTKKENKTKTEWISFESFLKLMGLSDSVYEKRFAQFKERILIPALKEINEIADITVGYDERTQRRKLTHLCFVAERKDADVPAKEIHLIDSTLEQEMKKMGLGRRKIDDIKKKYSSSDIEQAITCFHNFAKTNQVKNPGGLFLSTLEDGWVCPEDSGIVQTGAEIDFFDAHINQLSEDSVAKNIRRVTFEHIGGESYKAWFLNTKFTVDGNQLFIEVFNSFQKDHLEVNFAHIIKRLIEADGINLSSCVFVTGLVQIVA